MHPPTPLTPSLPPPPGLLQWVEDTQPLNSYLLGRNYAEGAHSRYAGPGEWSWMQCYFVSGGRGGGGELCARTQCKTPIIMPSQSRKPGERGGGEGGRGVWVPGPGQCGTVTPGAPSTPP